MTSNPTQITIAEVEAALGGLAVAAPPSLAHATLVAIGLADEYTTMQSPIGPVFVAWNGKGVSTVSGAISSSPC